VDLDYAAQQRHPGRHAIGFGVVLALHLLVGWALVTGLAQRMVEVIKAPIETKLIEEVKPPPPPPPENLPPPPKFAPPPPSYVPPPEVVVNAPPTAAPTITTTTVAPPPAPVTIAPPPRPEAPPAPPAPPPRKVAAKPAIGNVQACAPTSEDYPPAALRAEATGTTRIKFTVDAAGKLSGAEVVRSAGASREHRALDRVALSKLSECSFTPGIDENGKPVGGVFEVEYVWKIQ
jgi:protein TonB